MPIERIPAAILANEARLAVPKGSSAERPSEELETILCETLVAALERIFESELRLRQEELSEIAMLELRARQARLIRALGDESDP